MCKCATLQQQVNVCYLSCIICLNVTVTREREQFYHQPNLLHPLPVGTVIQLKIHIHSKMAGINKLFVSGRQHDAQEFLTYLYDYLMQNMPPV